MATNDRLIQATLGLDDAMETIVRVENAITEKGLKCYPNTALGSLFAAVRRLSSDSKSLDDTHWRVNFLRANEAVRIALAIEASLDDPGALKAIQRVTKTDMNLATRQESQGKDMLWELDLYRRLKLGDVRVRFEEPDLVVLLGDEFGDYGIACKKVYSEENIAKVFKKGCEQLAKQRKPGVVVFNLDDLAPENQVWVAATELELEQRLENMNRKFLNANAVHFGAAIACGNCDGVMVSTSVISEVAEMNPSINVTRSTAVYNYGAGAEARRRFHAFHHCLDNALTLLADRQASSNNRSLPKNQA